jgi:hypothetical protein
VGFAPLTRPMREPPTASVTCNGKRTRLGASPARLCKVGKDGLHPSVQHGRIQDWAESGGAIEKLIDARHDERTTARHRNSVGRSRRDSMGRLTMVGRDKLLTTLVEPRGLQTADAPCFAPRWA